MIIGKSILDAIEQSDLSDKKICNKVGVSQPAFYKWKTGQTKTMRRSNVNLLATVLDKEVIYLDGGTVEFKDINIEIEELNMATTNGDVLVKTIDNLWSQIEKKDEALLRKDKIIADWKEKYEGCLCHHENLPQLDHTQLQCLVHRPDGVNKGRYHSVSTAYAQHLGYAPYELLDKEFNQYKILHADDHYRLAILSQMVVEENPTSNTDFVWKLKTKNGKALYFKAIAVIVTDDISFITHEKATKGEWEKDDKYFKSLLNEV